MILFFIDECLTLDLVAEAHSRGHHATHVTFRSLNGTADESLAPILLEENFVLVTNNGKDFLKIYSSQEVHPGLIIIIPKDINAVEQVKLFDLVLDVIEPMDTLINKVITINESGDIKLADMPAQNSCHKCKASPCICWKPPGRR
jgi:predicted nuclease of predicted toxin-antitoxin system